MFHHVFLPRRLPHSDDSEPSNEYALIQALLVSLREFKHHLPTGDHPMWSKSIEMIEVFDKLRDEDGRLIQHELDRSLRSMRVHGMTPPNHHTSSSTTLP